MAMRALGPACTTCRQKCRRCDRSKPVCMRCISKGLECGGYPTTFKFYQSRARKARKSRREISSQGPSSPFQRSSHSSTSSRELSPEPPVPSDNFQYSTESTESNDTSAVRATEIIKRLHRSSSLLSETTAVSFHAPLNSTSELMPLTSMRHDASSPAFSVESRDLANIELSELLATDRTELLLTYYDNVVCPHLCLIEDGASFRNPFREFILPLAYEHAALLHAILGLTSCHMQGQVPETSSAYEAEPIEHRLEAIRRLIPILSSFEEHESLELSEDVPLAVILMLLLHDICESGNSPNGVHLSGVTVLLPRLRSNWRIVCHRRRTLFLLGTLSWLDLIRGFSGAEFCKFPIDIHRSLTDARDAEFMSVVGCPKPIFLSIAIAMKKAKEFKLERASRSSLSETLDNCEGQLRSWNAGSHTYPSENPGWPHLAEAFRHACILRVRRWHNTWGTANDSKIQASVSAILNACSAITSTSPLLKRLLLPLFMAGADSLSSHQRHYILIRINEIRNETAFKNPAVMGLLEKVWIARGQQDDNDQTNIPWMEFTCDELLDRQHDFLFF